MDTNSDFIISRYDAATGETVVVEPSSTELIEIEQMLADQRQWEAEYNAGIEAKKIAREALLAKLGITEEEARLLLGGN